MQLAETSFARQFDVTFRRFHVGLKRRNFALKPSPQMKLYANRLRNIRRKVFSPRDMSQIPPILEPPPPARVRFPVRSTLPPQKGFAMSNGHFVTLALLTIAISLTGCAAAP